MTTTLFKYHPINKIPSPNPIFRPPSPKQQLQDLRQKVGQLLSDFELFKEQTIASFREWLGRISALVYRQAKEKMMVESELQKSKQVQQSMRSEVIQLKEMINQAMIGYTREIQNKNNEIRRLGNMLARPQEETNLVNILNEIKNENDLEIIQQQSEQATFSTVNTLRSSQNQEKVSEKAEHSVYQEEHSPIKQNRLSPVVDSSQFFQFVEPAKPQKDTKNEGRRTKSFIDNFRKTIQESLQQNKPETINQQSQPSQIENIIQNNESISLHNPKLSRPAVQPLQQISNRPLPLQNKIYINYTVQQSEPKPIKPKITFNCGESIEISSISNSSQLTRGEYDQHLPIFRNLQTPTNQPTFKKKERENHRNMTEPSPQRIRTSHSYFSNKPLQTPAHIRNSSERPHSLQDKKSIKTSISKQKIKVASRMIDEMNHPRRNPTQNNAKAIVYLGGKSLFRKFLMQLKEAFKKYSLQVGHSEDEVKYEGQKRNRMRWGRGRLFYRNGMVYQGEFKQNMRHGRGSLYLNGISIYEGEWRQDSIEGQGYLKSMRYMAKQCLPIFNEASFCGNLMSNRLHGIGTIFLNPKQKIVTKFNLGVPVGELTYYNLHEIEFGVWPSE